MGTIDHEYRLIKLLGYGLIPDSENRCNIVDEEGKVVGYLDRRPFIKDNEQVWGYYIKINSDRVFFAEKRAEDDYSHEDSYDFIVKGPDGDYVVTMKLGKEPTISFTYNGNLIYLQVSEAGLYSSFDSKTENFNIHNTVMFSNLKDFLQEYIYHITYSKRNNEGKTTTREFSIRKEPNKKKIDVSDRAWFDERPTFATDYKVDGEFMEASELNDLGIEAMSHLRFVLNEALPFKIEAMKVLLSDTPYYDESGIEIFYPDLLEDPSKRLSRNK